MPPLSPVPINRSVLGIVWMYWPEAHPAT